MKIFYWILLAGFLLSFNVSAQTANPTVTSADTTTAKKRPPVFRATKDQIEQAQMMLKQKGMYSGEATGKLDDATRVGLKKFQEGEKINATGTLNRITLEKMGIVLTEKQKEIPITESSMTPTSATTKSKTPRGAVFRANKDQVMQAQKMLKDKGHYAGEQTGKLDDATRTSLKKYQEAEKIKVTGTLNRETLEKMGITLTDKQKTLQLPIAEKTN